jgi:hypothetical protein
MARHPISRYADTVGDGSGIKNAIGDYSGETPTIFKIAPSAGEIYVINRLIPFLRDTGGLDADKYGNNITLTNGIVIKVVRNVGEASEEVLWDATAGKFMLGPTLFRFWS